MAVAARPLPLDEAHLAAGGKKASQPQVHSWFVFSLDHFGPATINSVSLHRPDEKMPWAEPDELPAQLRLVSQY